MHGMVKPSESLTSHRGKTRDGKHWTTENTGQPGRTPLHQGLRIDPRRLVSKLLDIFNIGARINRGMAVRAALSAQFQHT